MQLSEPTCLEIYDQLGDSTIKEVSTDSVFPNEDCKKEKSHSPHAQGMLNQKLQY